MASFFMAPAHLGRRQSSRNSARVRLEPLIIGSAVEGCAVPRIPLSSWRRTLVVALAALTLCAAGSAALAADAATPEARVIVKYRAQADVLRQQALAAGSASSGATGQLRGAAVLGARLGLVLRDGHGLGGRMQLLQASGLNSSELAARLGSDAAVEWAVPDQRRRALVAPNDPLYGDNLSSVTPASGQWYLRAPSGDRVAALNVEAAWNTTRGLASIVVAVLDTGVRLDHPDLAGRLLPGHDFVSDPVSANDGDGVDADPSDPGDWVAAEDVASGAALAGCSLSNSSWHGTQTAGLIAAAADNGIGMAGTAPGAGVVPVRVLGKCGGYDSDIIAGMRWAAGLDTSRPNPNPAKVINLSLGSADTLGNGCLAYQDTLAELQTLGVVVVAAAGNDGLATGVPAKCSGVIGVAGVRHTGTKVGYSNLGPEVTIAAPAGNCVNSTGACLYPILSTSNDGTTVPGNPIYSDGIHFAVGTSFSAPLVSGTVALMLAANPA
ncbi:MAG: hypothetical protein RJA44_1494, partial [Pseudomonadota bacterium]